MTGNIQCLIGEWLGPESQSVVLYERNRWYKIYFRRGATWYITKALSLETEENADEEGIGQKGEEVGVAIRNHRKRASGIDFFPYFTENSHMSSEWDLRQFTLASTHPTDWLSLSSKLVIKILNWWTHFQFSLPNMCWLCLLIDLSKMAGQAIKRRDKSMILWPP